MQKIRHFINGQKEASDSESFLENFDPATGKVMSLIPRGGAAQVDQAVRAASQAFPAWSGLSSFERSNFLMKIADGIQARLEEFATLESRDQGKTKNLAMELDIPRAIHNFRFFAQAILHHENESTQPDAQTLNFVLRKPVGVAGLISPWNLPLYLLTWKIAPALAAGNTVVAKPSEYTSMTADLLAEVIGAAGVPAGVVNFVYGLGAEAGEALVQHPDVPLISFTGGTATGQQILRNAAAAVKKVSLELGGKNPNIIYADCDFEKAVRGTLRSSFLNQGEICLCGSRIYVERKILPRFLETFVAETKKLRVGPPLDPNSFMGPLVSKAHLQKVQEYLAIAKAEGGRIETGGDQPGLAAEYSGGYWLNPTVITGLAENSRCIQEEIFGPVVTVSAFDSVEEVIGYANGVSYGLAASLWTQNLTTAHRMARELRVGTVWINTWLQRDLRMPFGGMKQSGLGREGGRHSLDFFTEATTVCLRT